MANDQSVFSFELNESLYFEKGQEVAEIVGISLDPEISIQPFNDYISIRGVVELQGSYIRALLEDNQEDDSFFSENYQSKRYMEKVENNDQGGAEFLHRFPVEISIPSYRVNDLNDVSVMITEFDYELPDPNQLQLKSKIEIHGINETREETRTFESTNESEEIEDPVERQGEDSFEFEIKTEKEQVESSDHVIPEIGQVPTLESVESPETEELSDAGTEEQGEKKRWKYKQTQSFSEFFHKDESESPEDQYGDSPNETEELIDESPSPSPSIDLESPSSMEYEPSESQSEEGIKGITFLSKLFRSAEEETYSKVRVCIVQENDTIESIAERYETSTLQILSRNDIDGEEITEGQLLYIPAKNN